jgi:DNA-binding transcriptional LysR family regulator
MIDLRNLETFFWAAQLGGFGAAAARLSTTQPAVSQRIAALESELSARLFLRESRRVTLSAKGRDLLPYAEQMLRLRAELLQAAGSADAYRGHVRLGVAETIVHTRLTDLVKAVHATYPAITLDIDVDTSQRLRDGLLNGNLDIAILLGPVIEPNVRSLDFARYPMAWAASPSLALPGSRVALGDIARLPVITYQKGSRPPLDIRDLFVRAGIAGFRIYSSSSISTMVKLCVDGLGVSAIPPAVIERELANGELRLIEVTDGGLPELRFTVSYLRTAETLLLEAIATLALRLATAGPVPRPRAARRHP